MSPFVLYVGYYFPPWLCLTLLHFSHDWSNRSPSFSSTTFQNLPDMYDLFSSILVSVPCKAVIQVSTLLVSALNLSPVCWWRTFLFAECLLYHGNRGFDFTCTPCFTCYQGAQMCVTWGRKTKTATLFLSIIFCTTFLDWHKNFVLWQKVR